MSFSLQVPVDAFEMPHPRGDGAFKISVARVAHVPEGTKVPVLYVLDGDIGFALAAEIARMRGLMGAQPTAMIVGIGYGVDFLEFAKLRTADLTPPLSETGRAALGNMASFIGDRDGGADDFLSFLADRLAPEIGRRYPEASADDRSLFGHSLGGLFAAYALLTRPDAFRTFVVNSPSLWWDGFAINGHLPTFAEKLAKLENQPRVLIGVGGQEQDLPTKVPPGMQMSLEEIQATIAASRMVDAVPEFAAALSEAGLTEVEHIIYDKEDHTSVVPAAIMRGLRFAVPMPE